MKKLLLATAAVGLSGCSWLGLGQNDKTDLPEYSQYTQPAAPKAAKAVKSADGCCLSRWNVEAAIGPEFFFGGDAISGGDINDLSGATIPTALGGTGVAGTTVVTSNNQSIQDIYGIGARYELGGSYALSPNRKVTLSGHYSNADADETTLGTINGTDVTGQLSDFERYGFEAGLRQYAKPFNAPLVNSLRPYVEGRAGVTRIRDIEFVNSDDSATILPGTTPFIDGSWVPTATGLVGLETPVSKYLTMGIETGVRWTGAPDSDNSVLGAGVPLAGTNNFGRNTLSVPLQIRGRYRF